MERRKSGLIVPNGLGDRMKAVGDWEFKLFDEYGRLKQHECWKNLIVDVGFQLISDNVFIQASRPAVASYIAIGTNNTAAAAGNTTLGTELIRKLAAYSYASKVATLSVTFNAGEGTGALVEAGVLNASSSGILLNRVVYSVINKGALDVMTTNFTFTLS